MRRSTQYRVWLVSIRGFSRHERKNKTTKANRFKIFCWNVCAMTRRTSKHRIFFSVYFYFIFTENICADGSEKCELTVGWDITTCHRHWLYLAGRLCWADGRKPFRFSKSSPTAPLGLSKLNESGRVWIGTFEHGQLLKLSVTECSCTVHCAIAINCVHSFYFHLIATVWCNYVMDIRPLANGHSHTLSSPSSFLIIDNNNNDLKMCDNCHDKCRNGNTIDDRTNVYVQWWWWLNIVIRTIYFVFVAPSNNFPFYLSAERTRIYAIHCVSVSVFISHFISESYFIRNLTNSMHTL